MNPTLFISGIGTGIGKTICSAILARHFQAAYWKPIQAGDLTDSDSHKVSRLNQDTILIYPERYRLQKAASPHNAAAAEGRHISIQDFPIPEHQGMLLIEGAGGLWVPLSDHSFMIDLIEQTGSPVALVTRDYLGCINHTLLSIQALLQRNISLDYLIFNGTFDPDTFRVILKQMPTGTQAILIPELDALSPSAISAAAQNLKFLSI